MPTPRDRGVDPGSDIGHALSQAGKNHKREI
jgi:hypothetical protein